MPNYLYSCSDHPEVREDVVHSITEDPEIPCPECEKPMHRVPVIFRFYFNPGDVLLDRLDEGYREFRKKKARLNSHAN